MNEEKQSNNKKFLRPDILKIIIAVLIILAVAVLIFGAGIKVGELKARYSYRWADNYHKNFAGPSRGFMMDGWRDFAKEDFMEGHGIFGEIIKLNDKDFVIKSKKGTENIILLTQDTMVKKGIEGIEKGDLKVGDSVVVIGSPNEQGQIEAKLIRIFDTNENKTPFRKFLPHFF